MGGAKRYPSIARRELMGFARAQPILRLYQKIKNNLLCRDRQLAGNSRLICRVSQRSMGFQS